MATHTAKTPFGIDHLTDEAGLGEVGGREMFGEFGEQRFVFSGVVAGEHDGGGVETVGQAVTG